MDWIKNKANAAAGGGKASEKNEDSLDKGYVLPSLPFPSLHPTSLPHTH